jgi:hypothetical protein
MTYFTYKHDNLEELIDNFKREITEIACWFHTNKMAVNISKTKFIIFYTRGKLLVMRNMALIYMLTNLALTTLAVFYPIEQFHNNHESHEKKNPTNFIHLDEHLSFNHHTIIFWTKLTGT